MAQKKLAPGAPAVVVPSDRRDGSRATPGDVPAPAAQAAAFPALRLAVSREEREALGRAIYRKVPHQELARWKADRHRRSPLEILRKSDPERLPDLVPIRYGRMLQSPFAFYRGSAAVMAADLATTRTTDLRVQACGDCHLMNFGGFATPERNVVFDINDFDETLPAPWDWDVRRLVASIVLAARSIGLSDKRGRDCATACARSYREHLHEFSTMDPLELWYARISGEDVVAIAPRRAQKHIRKRVEKALSRGGSDVVFPELADAVGGQIRIRDQPPLIFHPAVAQTSEFEQVLEAVMRGYRESLTEERRMLLDRYRVLDAAIKVVGIGSVGRRCWITLLISEDNTPLFLQFKEAVESVLEPFAGASAYAHHGQRVVMGQGLMQPASDIFLGWVTAPNGKHFYVRQLRDAKIKPLVETFDLEVLDAYARACGWVLARAHAKVSEISATIGGYLGSSEDFDEAMGRFAVAYADQAERDHAALKHAVRLGKIDVYAETT